MLGITFSVGKRAVQLSDVPPDAEPSGTGSFLVYFHRDVNGKVFYVGEGVGKRPWSIDRHELWHHYVRTRSEGKWTTQIVSRHLSKESAQAAEDDWIAYYAGQLVNWFGRDSDWRVQIAWLKGRDESRATCQAAKVLFESQPDQAFALFRQGVDAMYRNADQDGERGIVGELMKEVYHHTADSHVVDWYTVALMKAGRYKECIEAVERYCARFPPRSETDIPAIRKRAIRAAKLRTRH